MIISFFALLTLCLTATQSANAQQTISQSIDIKWSDAPVAFKVSSEYTLYYYDFEGASFDDTKPQLPIWSTIIPLNNNATVQARLVNTRYAALGDVSAMDLSSVLAIELQTAVAFKRKQPFASVSFVPIRKNPISGQYEKLISADLQLTTSPINTAVAAQARSLSTNSVLSDGALYKIAIDRTGIFKLDWDFLNNLGIDLANIDPRTIQVFGNGGQALKESMLGTYADDLTENTIYIEGEADGSFDQGDYLLFYGVSTHTWTFNDAVNCGKFVHQNNPYTDNSYYFIKVGTNNGLRIGNRASLPNTNYATESYDALKHYEIDALNLMEMEFALPPSGREWYGESFRISRTRDFNFSFTNRIESEPVYINSDLAVRVFSAGSASMSVNGVPVGTAATQATTTYIYTDYAKRLNFPCTPLVYTGQDINAQIALNHSSSAAEMWLNYLTVQARCQLRFSTGQLPFRDVQTVGQGTATYTLKNANNVIIWDVTNPAAVQSVATGSGALSFGADASVLREFVAFDNNQFYTPTAIGPIENQNLHGIQSPPEAVFVVHASIKEEAERLAAHRRSHDNMTVDVIDVQDIYNEFSSGKEDVTAIRDFCRMLYDRETATNKFTHLLLFGIGTFDYKSIGDTRTTENNPNLVPVYETQESMHPINTYTSDDYFALLDSTESMPAFSLLDIAVGRLPAANLNEAKVLVDKIIGYDTDPAFLRDWKNRISFVADDEDNNLHFYDAEGVASVSVQRDSVFNIDKIYIDAFKQVSTSGGERYPDAKNALLDNLFKGVFLINYLGHGGEDGWTQERIFTSSDINALNNSEKLPLFITATCSFGPHDDPTNVSAGELLLLNPNGGAISLLTTVRVVIASHNERLVRNTINVIFNKNSAGEYLTTGEVMQLAKNNAAIAPPVNSRKYALLGDPTMKLSYPKYNVRTDSINGATVNGNDTLRALQRVTISGQIVDDNDNIVSGFNGLIYPTVFDKEDRIYTLGNDDASFTDDFYLRKKIIFKGKATVSNGRYSFSFVVPKDINYAYGTGKISYYAQNNQDVDANGFYSGLVVGGSYPNAVVDNVGPEVLVYMNDESFARGGITDNNPKLLIKLYDENGINTVGNSIGHDLTAKVIDPDIAQEEYILNDFYESDVDDFTHGTALYQLKDLSPGIHTVNVKAWDVYNNPGEGSTEFVVAESANLALEHVLNYPNPFTTNTDFQFEHNLPFMNLEVQVQIFTVSGKLVKTIDHAVNAELNTGYRVSDINWDGRDDYGDRIGRGVYIYKIFVQAEGTTDKAKQSSAFEKLVILK
jgi:hypothetical protein